jgi:hypothetical protein
MARFVVTLQQAIPVEFGLLTLAGEGGYPVTGASISSGNTGTHWEIVGGVLRPTAAAVAASYSGAPYTLTLNDSSMIYVTCPANVRHVANLTQLQAAATATNNAGVLAGKTVKLRAGTYAGELYNNSYFANVGTMTVFEADNPNDKPLIDGGLRVRAASDGIGRGNVTFKNLKIYRAQDTNAHQYIGPTVVSSNFGVVGLLCNEPVILDGCEIYSNLQPTVDTGGLLIDELPGVTARGTGIQIKNCTIRNVSIGLQTNILNGLVEGNTIRDFFHDAVRVGGGTMNTPFRNNRIYDMIGFGNVVHGDLFQFTDPNSGAIGGITIEGNVIMLGAGASKALPGCPFDAAPGTTNLGVNTTLDATHVGRIIQATANSLTFTMPDPALYPQEQIWFNRNSATSVTLAGTITGGDVTVSAANHQGTYSLRSNGSSWVKADIGLRAGIGLLNSNITLTSRTNQLIYRVDATAGNITITLPAISGFNQVGFQRIDNTGNTVTIQRAGSDPMTYRGNSVTSYSLPPRKAITMRNLSGLGTWVVTAGTIYVQGLFGNPNIEHTIVSSTTVLAAKDGFIQRIDATNGNRTITLPAITGRTRFGFKRVDSSGNTVTINRNGSDPMTPTTSYNLAAGAAVSMFNNGGTWEINEGEAYQNANFSVSGLETRKGGQGDVTVRGNIIFTDASWLYRLEEASTTTYPEGSWYGYCRIYNNDFLRLEHFDDNADGAIDSFDDWYTADGTTTPKVAPQGVKDAINDDNFCVRNVIGGGFEEQGWGVAYIATGTGDENVVMTLGPNDGASLNSTYDAIMSTPAANYRPQTPAEAIAISALVDQGVRGASYYWDFAAGAKKSGATEPTIP